MPFGTDGQALGLITFFDSFQDVQRHTNPSHLAVNTEWIDLWLIS